MRPLLVVVIAVVTLGGVKWFIDSYDPPGANENPLQMIEASGDYSVELTTTFDAGPDEFSLDDVGDAPSLLVQLNGEEIFRKMGTLTAAETPLTLDEVSGVVVGQNEFFVQASPADVDSPQPRSVRVRILQDGIAVATATLWPELGDIVQGTLGLEVRP